MKFSRNVGRLDQVLRIGISLILFYVSLIDTGFIDDPISSGILAVIGVSNLVVAMIRICPLYTVTGIDTTKLS